MARSAALAWLAIGFAWIAQAAAQPVPTPPPSGEKAIPMIGFGHYPKLAWLKGADGEATVRCRVGLARVIKACDVVSESPAGLGFGSALAEWAKALQPDIDPKRGYPRSVEISYHFRMPKPGGDWYMPTPDGLLPPHLFPERALSQEKSGGASLSCLVDEAGGFQDCKVVSESPTGLGFGQSALQLIEQFRAYPLVPSAVGKRAKIPLQFKLQ